MIKIPFYVFYMIRFAVWISQSRPLIQLTTATMSTVGCARDMPGSASWAIGKTPFLKSRRQTRYPEARRFNRCLLCLRETRVNGSEAVIGGRIGLYMWWAGHKSMSVDDSLFSNIPVLIWIRYEHRLSLTKFYMDISTALSPHSHPISHWNPADWVPNSRRQPVGEHQVEILDLRCLLMIRDSGDKMLGFRLTCFTFWIMSSLQEPENSVSTSTTMTNSYHTELSHRANVVLLSLILIQQENKKHTSVSITSVPFQSNVAIAVTQKFGN